MYNRYMRNLTLDKQKVKEAYRDTFQTVPVKFSKRDGSYFNLIAFGKFELNDTEFIFGTEEEEFKASMADPQKTRLPITIAEKMSIGFNLTPWFDFDMDEQDRISECIGEKLDNDKRYSELIMSHYSNEGRC